MPDYAKAEAQTEEFLNNLHRLGWRDGWAYQRWASVVVENPEAICPTPRVVLPSGEAIAVCGNADPAVNMAAADFIAAAMNEKIEREGLYGSGAKAPKEESEESTQTMKGKS